MKALRFLVLYVLWPVVKAVAIVLVAGAALLFGPPLVLGLDGAMWLLGGVLAFCILALTVMFLLSAWENYTADAKRRASTPHPICADTGAPKNPQGCWNVRCQLGGTCCRAVAFGVEVKP
jgi:TRAP-type C4-dicarboxylate transport system permease small subunit